MDFDFLLSTGFWIELLSSGLRLGAPILIAALGEIIAERSGVINIGMEGMILVGALFAVFTSDITRSPYIAILGGMAAAAVIALIFAFITITLASDQIITGTAINIMILGLTSYLFRLAWGLEGITRTVPAFTRVAIPILSEIPVIGQIFFRQTIMVYGIYLTVPIFYFLIYRTQWGLTLRSVGEHPRAADTVGISVTRTRYLAVIIGGMMSGVAGAALSLSNANLFAEGMSAGRGFMALAAVIFAQWNPYGAALACFFFGSADALAVRLQLFSRVLPYQIFATLPYLLTILALIGIVGRARPPRALATPYLREQGNT